MLVADRCDRLALLADGNSIAARGRQELCDRTGLRVLRIETSTDRRPTKTSGPAGQRAKLDETVIYLPRPCRTISHAMRLPVFDVPVTNVQTESPTIEDVFVRYVHPGRTVPPQ
jgi:hypothetical protein